MGLDQLLAQERGILCNTFCAALRAFVDYRRHVFCWRHSDDLFVIFGVKPTQKDWGRDLPRDQLCSSPCICRLSQACILHEKSSKATSHADFCWLCPSPSLDCYLKPTGLFCPALSTASLCLPLSTHCLPWDLPSLVHYWSRGRSRPQSFCVGFTPKMTKRSSEWRQQKQKQTAMHHVTNGRSMFWVNIQFSAFTDRVIRWVLPVDKTSN